MIIFKTLSVKSHTFISVVLFKYGTVKNFTVPRRNYNDAASTKPLYDGVIDSEVLYLNHE